MVSLSDLVTQTLTLVKAEVGDDEAIFVTEDGRRFRMHHHQDCCESVTIAEIHGDIDSLLGTPILYADEVSGETPPQQEDPNSKIDVSGCDTYSWTFYRFVTLKGPVQIRWLGSSNGYYSHVVSFEEMT